MRGATLDPFGGIMTVPFQSTLPVRGATRVAPRLRRYSNHFNPRSPCGERRHHHSPYIGKRPISIHAPRAGSDLFVVFWKMCTFRFQSTLPVRGATRCRGTHAGCPVYFNPRSPCGERLDRVWVLQSVHFRISIHAPRAGSDPPASYSPSSFLNFNPRSPCGERPALWTASRGA